MKKIYWSPISSDSNEGYYLVCREECCGEECYEGNLLQYIFDNVDYDFACASIWEDYEGVVRDLPDNAIVLSVSDVPKVVYWLEGEDDAE